MTSGQRILADLLELTNAATKSLGKPEDEFQSFQTTQKTKKAANKVIPQNSEQPDRTNVDANSPQDGDFVSEKNYKSSPHVDSPKTSSPENCSIKEGLNMSESSFDASRSIKVSMPRKLLKEATDMSSDSSKISGCEIESGSPPQPSDNVKAGVFVSSSVAAFTDKTMEASFTKSSPAKTASNQHHLTTNKISNGLIQGDCKNQAFSTRDEVMVMSYPEGQKKNVLQEKFKARMLNAGPVKKKVMPRIVQSNVSKSQSKEVNEMPANSIGQKDGENHVTQSAAESAVSYASIATSAAIAPFLQIQNALESQISSLVNSISLAHSAKEQMETHSQERSMRNLEQKLIDGFDKRISRMEELQAQALRDQLSVAAKMKENNGPKFDKDSKSADSKLVSFPGQATTVHHDLQMIPTRDKEPITNQARVNAPITSGAPENEPIGNRLQQMNGFSHMTTVNQQRNFIRPTNFEQHRNLPYHEGNSNPQPKSRSLYTDKSTSPFLEQFLSRNKSVKTQTSSAESSILSEESLLDTPLPRSKIPVPFSRYTPKGDKRRCTKLGTKRVVSRSAKSDYKSMALPRKQPLNAEKENLDPKKYSSTDRSISERLQNPGTRSALRQTKSPDNHKLEIIKDGMKDLQKETMKMKEHLQTLDLKPQVSDLSKPKELQFNKDIAPIDNYLIYPIRGKIPDVNKVSVQEKRSIGKEKDSATSRHAKSSGGHHHIEASRILEEIKLSRNRLENNLESILRHKDQSRLYNFIDHQQVRNGNEDVQRIRIDVDKRIEEIAAQVKQELQAPEKDPLQEQSRKDAGNTKAKKELKKDGRDKSNIKARPSQVRQAQAAKSKTKAASKVKGTVHKDKEKKKVETDPIRESEPKPLYRLLQPSQLDEELLARVYGRPTFDTHRTTIRPAHIQFHSPPKKPKEKTTGKTQEQKPSRPANFRTAEYVGHQSRKTETPGRETSKTKYYFQPTHPEYVDEHKDIEAYYPSSGDLVPVAVSLGKPRQDSSLRLPIPLDEEKFVQKSTELNKRSNVAVVEICADDMQKSKDKEATRKPRNLTIQNLPNVDIETPSSETPKNRFLLNEVHHSSPNEQPFQTPPRQEDYANFQNYIATNEIEKEDESDAENITEENLGMQFHGIEDAEPKDYNAPPFPPQQPHYENEANAVEIRSRLTVEEKAQEWVEQEILARIMSQMNVPVDPTLVIPAERSVGSETSSLSDEEEHNWIHDLIGPSGLQLFVDSGLPINNEIIQELIRDVIAERLKTLLGHPKQKTANESKKVTQEEHDSQLSSPSIVSTPIQTPVYTPVPSEAPSIQTPTASCVSPESSEKSILSIAEEKEKTSSEPEDYKDQHEQSILTTPPQTPKSQRKFSALDQHLETPVSSLKEDEEQTEKSLARTPEASLLNETLISQSEFERSGTIIETEEEKTPTASPPSSEPTQTLPKPMVNVIRKSPSPKTSSFTISSNTTVGSSLFEGISEGEHLCPDSVIPGLYSEGEFPVSEGQAILSPVNELEEDEKTNFKQLLQKAMGKDVQKQLDNEEVSDTATLKDTDDIEEDTLEEVSVSEGELLAEEYPVVKLLNQIKSPPNAQSTTGGVYYNQEKSEGEVSFGQQIKERNKEPAYQRLSVNGTRELRRKDLSSGELTSLSNNGGKIPSYSVGEVRNLSIGDLGQNSKAESNSVAVQDMGDSELFQKGPRANLSDSEAGVSSKEIFMSEIKSPGGKQSSEASSLNRIDYETGKGATPTRAILVQSRDFDNASTFNFTDSLNETRLGTLKDLDLGTLNEQQIDEAVEQQIDEAMESPKDGGTRKWNQSIDEEKMPTKITLMIPSVADEDSADELTLEGDVYSYDDGAAFSD